MVDSWRVWSSEVVAVGDGSGFVEELGELSLVRVEEVSVGER